MDATVIEEIAKQLGMAVGEAAEFTEEILPQYAGLQIIDNVIPAVACLVMFIVSVFSIARSIGAMKKLEKEEAAERMGYWSSRGVFDDHVEKILLWGVAMLVFAIFGGTCIGDALGWAIFPDAKLLDMAINAISD